jgi:hypothetical protein
MKNFFGLNKEHQKHILQEQYVVSRHIKGISFNDTLMMPTYVRRMFLHYLKEESDAQKQHYEEAQAKQKGTEKGSRTTTISGEAVNKY